MSFHKDTVWCFRVYILNFRVLGASQGFEAQGLRGLALFGGALDSYPKVLRVITRLLCSDHLVSCCDIL